MHPEVSIIITNYNYSKYIEKCIESCLKQNVTFDYEVIVVDDGSTDDSVNVITPYLNDQVRLIQIGNSGIEFASNTGMKNARAELIVRVDADDYLLPDYLNLVVPAMKDSGCSFVYPDYVIVDGEDNILHEMNLPPFDAEEISERGDFLATGTMYRKTPVENLNFYDTSVRNCGLENYCLILKLIKSGQVGMHLPYSLFAYRRHGLNVSVQKKDAIINYGRTIFSEIMKIVQMMKVMSATAITICTKYFATISANF